MIEKMSPNPEILSSALLLIHLSGRIMDLWLLLRDYCKDVGENRGERNGEVEGKIPVPVKSYCEKPINK